MSSRRSSPITRSEPPVERADACLQLASAQRATWLFDRQSPGGTAWSVARAVSLPGADSAEVAGAVLSVVAERPSLALACSAEDGQPVPVRAAPLHLRHVAASPHPQLLADLADHPFDLQTGPLTRAVVFDGALLLVASSLVADSDSLGLLIEDVQRVLGGGAPHPVEAPPADHGPPPSRLIDLSTERPKMASHTGRRFVRRLSPVQLLAADALADRLGTARANVFLGAYAWLLHRLTGRDDVLIHVVTRRADAGNAVGPFSPTLPMRLSFASPRSMLQLVASIGGVRSGASDGAGRAGDMPPEGTFAAVTAVDAIFEDGDDGLPGMPVLCGRGSARSDIALVALPGGVGWEHGPAFNDSSADEFADEFERILMAGLAQPDAMLARADPSLVLSPGAPARS